MHIVNKYSTKDGRQYRQNTYHRLLLLTNCTNSE